MLQLEAIRILYVNTVDCGFSTSSANFNRSLQTDSWIIVYLPFITHTKLS